MKKLALLICALVIISGFDNGESKYPSRPKKTPYFYNETSIIEANQDICTELRRARKLTNIEFVMVLLKEIPNTIHIGEYSAELFHKWRIGSKTKGKGVLILFVENTHTFKIEVSYELEGIFTDTFCSSFQPTIKSYYAGEYFGDVFTGVILCMERKAISGIDVEFDTALENLIGASEPLEVSDAFLSGGGGIIDNEYFYDKDIKLSMIRQLSEERICEFDCDRDIDVVLSRYFKSLEEGINYPFLGIFTEGSQMMRLEYPESINFLRSQWQDYQKEFPYRIIYNKRGDLAAIRFKGLLWPLFLRKTPEGFWKIDVTKGWAFSQANWNLTEIYPLYKDHPWMFAFPEYGYKKSKCNIPKLIPFPLNIKERIAKLEAAIKRSPHDASNYFKLADIFYWECYWIRAAIDLAEKGLEIEPDNIPYRWLAIYMRYRFPKVEGIPAHYEALLKINPCDRYVLKRYVSYCTTFSQDKLKATVLLLKFWPKCMLWKIGGTPALLMLFFSFLLVGGGTAVLMKKRKDIGASRRRVEDKPD
jgi:hypothetical protein